MKSLKALTANLLQYRQVIETALCFFCRRIPVCIRNPAPISGILRDAFINSFPTLPFYSPIFSFAPRNTSYLAISCIFVCYDFYVRNFFTGNSKLSRNTIKSSKALTANFFPRYGSRAGSTPAGHPGCLNSR